ncbi:MAG: squalene/phytoene synthase family protein [Alphaproteobacteria bacterium]|nr:squalene/phytoene synthase family protein [Alphaproteobacteria bacterium]
MSLTYNGNSVRQQDPDFFLLSLFAPRKYRKALWALFAFHYEIAKTRDVVSESQIGLIRLQWWREAIEEIYAGDQPRHHAALIDLAEAIKTHDLQQSCFEEMIVAREVDFREEERNSQNLEQLQAYMAEIYVPLLSLSLKILGQAEEGEVIQQVAANYGLIKIIRSVAYIYKREAPILPQDITGQMGAINSVRPQSKFLRRLNKMSVLYRHHMASLGYDFSNPRFTLPPRFMALKLLFMR